MVWLLNSELNDSKVGKILSSDVIWQKSIDLSSLC